MKGISLVEILLVIALFSILGATSTPIYTNFLARQYLENKTNEVLTSIYTAKTNTLAGKQDSSWGVHFDQEITLFQGDSYSTRNSAFDQAYSIPKSVSISAPTDIIFTLPYGYPDTTATITISNNLQESNTININSLGTINLN